MFSQSSYKLDFYVLPTLQRKIREARKVLKGIQRVSGWADNPSWTPVTPSLGSILLWMLLVPYTGAFVFFTLSVEVQCPECSFQRPELKNERFQGKDARLA